MVASAELSSLQFTLPQGMPVPGGQPPLMTAVAWADADAAQAARNAEAALQSYQQAQAALNAQQQSFQQQQAYRHQPYQRPVQQHQKRLPGPQVGGPFAGVALDWPVPMLLTVHTRFAGNIGRCPECDCQACHEGQSSAAVNSDCQTPG